MKKQFKSYALIWAILLAVWCVVVFLVRPIIPGYVINYDGRFWVAFGFIAAAFVGNLVCAFIAFRAENLRKMFYNLPLITVSWSALIAMLIVGSALMLIPDCPAWITAIVCIIILAFNAIAVIKASWAANVVNEVDQKVQAQTSFIKNLVVDTESILSHAKSDPVKAECKKVYEAVRFSDLMSNEALSAIEAKITVKLDELSAAVADDDPIKTKEFAREIVALVNDRNAKCRELK